MPKSRVTFSEKFVAETISVLRETDADSIEAVARGLSMLRDQGGRLFILGVGDSSTHARRAASDFRNICDFEAYAPTDSCEAALSNWLIGCRLVARDGILVFSVGGGAPNTVTSVDLVDAIDFCRMVGASVFGILGRDGGHTAQVADACVVIPPVFSERIGPHTEGLFAVVWHLLVSHPVLQRNDNRAADFFDRLSGQPLAQLAP